MVFSRQIETSIIFSCIFSQTRGTPKNLVGRTSCVRKHNQTSLEGIKDDDNLEGVYEASLQSLIVCKPYGGSTVGRQVDVDYLKRSSLIVVPVLASGLPNTPESSRQNILMLKSEKPVLLHG